MLVCYGSLLTWSTSLLTWFTSFWTGFTSLLTYVAALITCQKRPVQTWFLTISCCLFNYSLLTYFGSVLEKSKQTYTCVSILGLFWYGARSFWLFPRLSWDVKRDQYICLFCVKRDLYICLFCVKRVLYICLIFHVYFEMSKETYIHVSFVRLVWYSSCLFWLFPRLFWDVKRDLYSCLFCEACLI